MKSVFFMKNVYLTENTTR